MLRASKEIAALNSNISPATKYGISKMLPKSSFRYPQVKNPIENKLDICDLAATSPRS